MIKNSKLIGTVIDAPFGWKEFAPLELFDFPMAKSLDKDNLVIQENGSPYVTRTVDNNGINELIDISKVDNEYVNPANEFSFGLLGLVAFYQSQPYVAGQFVRRFVPKFKMTRLLAIYFKTLIDSLKPQLLKTSIRGYVDVLKLKSWSLPVTKQGTPDYVFMESYIVELEKAHVVELEKFLTVSDLNDTTLTSKEQEVLDLWRKHEQSPGGGR